MTPPESDKLAAPSRFLAPFRRVTTSGGFIPEIDGLRFIAISVVVLFHLVAGLQIKAPALFAAPAGDLFATVAHNGFRGVELFFVISGFILALPFAAHHLSGRPRVQLGAYYLRRVTRLEPPYILAMLGLYALYVLVRGRSAAELRPHLAASLVYAHNLIYASESPINNVSWSLEVEIQFYVLAPLLSLLFAIRSKAQRRGLIVALCAVSVATSWLFISPGQRAYLSILRFTHFFLLGYLLADVFLVDWAERPKQRLSWDLVSLAGWPLLFLCWGPADPSGAGREPLFALVAPALMFALYCAAFRGTLSNRLIRNPWVTTLGGMCYSIYLLHNPAMNLILRATHGLAPTPWYAANVLLQLVVAGPLLLLPTAAFFVLVEKPCMRRDWPRRALDRVRSWKPALSR